MTNQLRNYTQASMGHVETFSTMHIAIATKGFPCGSKGARTGHCRYPRNDRVAVETEALSMASQSLPVTEGTGRSPLYCSNVPCRRFVAQDTRGKLTDPAKELVMEYPLADLEERTTPKFPPSQAKGGVYKS